jgi:hypothetical protein
MTSKMCAEKLPISYMDGLAAAIACCHDAPYTCTVAVRRSKLEIKKVRALKVQGLLSLRYAQKLHCVDSLQHFTAAVLKKKHAVCLQGSSSSSFCRAPVANAPDVLQP